MKSIKDLQSGSKIALILIIIAGIVIPLGIAANPFSFSVISETLPPGSVSFSPFRSSLASFKIYDHDSRAELGEITTISKYHDPNSKYPDIDCWISDPFLTDSSGQAVFDPEDYISYIQDPDNYFELEFKDGKQYFLYEMHMGIECGARTYGNLGKAKGDVYMISPLKGISYGKWSEIFANRPCEEDDPADCPLPEGVLLATCDAGKSGNPVEWELTGCKVGTSLEEIYCPRLSYSNLFGINENLSRRYGNSRVDITPRIQLDAYQDLLKWNFQKELEDGSSIQVETERSYMTITNIEPVLNMQKYGEVPNISPVGLAELPPQDEEKEDLSTTLDLDEEDIAPVTQELSQREAYFKRIDEYQEETQGASITPSLRIESNITGITQINSVDDFNQDSAFFEYEISLQPKTTSYWVKYEALSNGRVFSGNWWEQFEKDYWYRDEIKWPYKVEITNVYHVYRVVATVVILAENKITYFPTSGDPIDISTIQDYEDLQAGALTSDLGGTEGLVIKETSNIFTELEQWWMEYGDQATVIIGLITTIAIVIAVIVVIIRFGGTIAAFLPKKR